MYKRESRPVGSAASTIVREKAGARDGGSLPRPIFDTIQNDVLPL
jgi:hypothetical protein